MLHAAVKKMNWVISYHTVWSIPYGPIVLTGNLSELENQFHRSGPKHVMVVAKIRECFVPWADGNKDHTKNEEVFADDAHVT